MGYNKNGRSDAIMVEKEKSKESKRKFALWVKESTLDLAKNHYKADNCSSQSEFIEKAIVFYTGYLSAEDNRAYLPSVIVSTLKGIVAESEHKQGRALFKLAVEMSIMMNLIAANNDIDKVTLERLRGECVAEVKRLNGKFTFDDALKWQKG